MDFIVMCQVTIQSDQQGTVPIIADPRRFGVDVDHEVVIQPVSG